MGVFLLQILAVQKTIIVQYLLQNGASSAPEQCFFLNIVNKNLQKHPHKSNCFHIFLFLAHHRSLFKISCAFTLINNCSQKRKNRQLVFAFISCSLNVQFFSFMQSVINPFCQLCLCNFLYSLNFHLISLNPPEQDSFFFFRRLDQIDPKGELIIQIS